MRLLRIHIVSIITAGIFALSSSFLFGAEYEISLNAYYAYNNGVRNYTAPDLKRNETDWLIVPSIEFSVNLENNWNFNFGYSEIKALDGSGITIGGDYFHEYELVVQVPIPFRSKESIDEWYLGCGYAFKINKNILIIPSVFVSYYNSNAKIVYRSFNADDFSATFGIESRFSITENLGVSLIMRYLTPPDREIFMTGIGVWYSFP